jgi:NAD(P)-dependent dehydrogenase (short-subunit alcohol dehydrogenase family)
MSRNIMLITGVSSGLGKALAEEALRQKWRVVGTVRKEADRQNFEALDPEHAIGRILDVTHTATVPKVVADVEGTIGPVDVLVNNAGYGLFVTIEEAPLEEVRQQFETNVFGQIAVLQAVLPYMRQRRRGHVLNVTSMGGLVAFPIVGIYNASKFAMEAVTEALAQEVKDFGIKVTAIEPGMFKTDWIGRSLRRVEPTISDYDALRKRHDETPLHWNGDLAKAAQAILTIIAAQNPPSHALLGSIADRLVGQKLENVRKEFAAGKELSAWTDAVQLNPMR